MTAEAKVGGGWGGAVFQQPCWLLRFKLPGMRPHDDGLNLSEVAASKKEYFLSPWGHLKKKIFILKFILEYS